MIIKISDKAKEKMAKDFKTDSDENYVRIQVKAINWAGPNLGLALDGLKDSDEVIEQDGFRFVVSTEIYDMFKTVEINYASSWLYKDYVLTYS